MWKQLGKTRLKWWNLALQYARAAIREVKNTMWTAMKHAGRESVGELPADRGRYLLQLSPPFVQDETHFVHFSWLNESFCIRDFMKGIERRQGGDLTASSVWQAAEARIPATGQFFVPVENYEFWTQTLTQLSQARSTHWSSLSSKYSDRKTVTKEPDQTTTASGGQDTKGDEEHAAASTVSQRFRQLWSSVPDFEIVQGTRGYSARFRGEPLLWVYPNRFQIAPAGKGNVHENAVRALRDARFPEVTAKGSARFEAAHFSWERLAAFVDDVRHLMLTT